MSAPERFRGGGTVPIEDAVWIGEGGFPPAPTPLALDPFTWDLEQILWPADGPGPLIDCEQYPFPAWVAWSRFCYWAASTNLAARRTSQEVLDLGGAA